MTDTIKCQYILDFCDMPLVFSAVDDQGATFICSMTDVDFQYICKPVGSDHLKSFINGSMSLGELFFDQPEDISLCHVGQDFAADLVLSKPQEILEEWAPRDFYLTVPPSGLPNDAFNGHVAFQQAH